MKTTTQPNNNPARHLTKTLGCLGLIFAACTLVSCGTGSPTKPVSSPVALQSSHWFKAKSDPPTYFPKGVPADHPTTYKDGSWVMTGDAAGTRYFIPLRGVDSRTLTAEAMSTMTPERCKDLERGGSPDVNLAEGIGNAATGLGYLLLEVDERATMQRYTQDYGPIRGATGLWEKTERR